MFMLYPTPTVMYLYYEITILNVTELSTGQNLGLIEDNLNVVIHFI